jgi:hypothetical protein
MRLFSFDLRISNIGTWAIYIYIYILFTDYWTVSSEYKWKMMESEILAVIKSLGNKILIIPSTELFSLHIIK